MRQRCRAARYIHRSITQPLLAAICAGCVAIPGTDGTTHYVVIGFGVVSVNETPDPAVTATHVNAVGLTLASRPGLALGLGYVDSTVTTIPSGAENVIVEVRRGPGGAIIVDCPQAESGTDSESAISTTVTRDRRDQAESAEPPDDRNDRQFD